MTDEARLKRLVALTQLQAELLEKFSSVNQEMAELLGGGAGIGAKLKACYAAFDAAWGERYANGEPGHYQWPPFASEVTPHLKKFLKTLSVEELSRRFVAYVADTDPFLLQRRHPFGLFVRNVNAYVPANGSAVFELDAPPPSDCRHTPRCKDDYAHTQRKTAEMRI